MKGRALILIFLFLILTSLTSVCSAETGHFEISGSMQETQTIDGTYCLQHAVNLWFNDWSTVTGIERIVLAMPMAEWAGSSDESYWRTVQYRTGSITGPVVATGQFGYNKGSSVVYIIAFFDDGITGTGASRMYITTSSGSIYPDVIRSEVEIGAPGSSADVYMISDHTGDPLPLNGENCVYYGYEFYNEYEYTQTSNQRLFNLTRDASNKSKLYIDDNGSNNLLTETSLKSDNLPFVWQITENNTWSLTLENEYGDIFYRDITYTTPEEATGTIDLSVTTYIKPDIVMADISLENADFINNQYYAVLQKNPGGGWEDFNVWKPITSYADMLIVWDGVYNGQSLPLLIRGILYEYDLNDETYTTIAFSDSSTYVAPPLGSEGQVWFSKNHYQFPESVQVIADLDDDSDFDKYQYFVGLTEWNGTGWQLLSTWAFLLSDTERTYTWGELEFSQSFPTVIRSHIYGYNKYTDNTETIATSTNATYTIMPGESTGQLWTDKSVYNVSEKVYIYFNTSYADNKVLVSFPHNFLIWDDSPANTINTKVLIPDLHKIGTWKIYLYESGILTNQTSIQIVGGSEIGCSWQYSDVPIGTPADFWYTSANSSAVITAWDGDGNQIYNSTTDIGTYQGSITTSGREPGIYLLSMLHNGTYYNSSMEVVAYDSWVRFDSSEYQIGDTINIEYFLIDDGEAISLWDGDSHLVIRFTQTNNVISTGYSKSVPFSLTDGNEYGMDIEFGVGTGAYATGVWDVFIEDKYGAFGDAWDSARVSVDTTDSPADTSNEMISIFFSPEGVFMLFTVCLTMMGLVLAKHPAGGGAGAVVGVGFGVYFNVLPVWMLILTVITLVVLAGVSIAVYFKGK